MENISKHITYEEATESFTAKRKQIANVPNVSQLNNMQDLAINVFEPVREHFNKPIKINSFFRSSALNISVGGASGSQHCANSGSAIDIDGTNGITNKEIFDYIRNNIEFDQLIWEFGDSNEPSWVHVSYNKRNNRKIVLKAIKSNGKTSYIKM
jgi:zinc D-Ala-D-Ala carboxypeptidase